jgi:hypothetical protein
MMTHEQSNFRRASVGLLQKGVHQILKSITTAKQAKFRACRVSRAVRMVKESLRLETMQLGRWKEFRHSQVTVSGVKDSFAPKGFFPFLTSQASERKPDTIEFPRDFRHSE